MSDELVAVRGLDVRFDGFRAITDLDLTINRGELRFLIGPNGAGKTTLVDVITGLTKPYAGSVRFDGQELVGRREHQIVRLGVGRTFQTSVVFEQLTVLENLDLAANFRRGRSGVCSPDAVGCWPRSRRRSPRRVWSPWPTGRPGCFHTASGSGWRSAC